MYTIPNYNPYHPRSGATVDDTKLPPVKYIEAAKERIISGGLISRDGQTIYKNVMGEWQRATWSDTEGGFGSWWSMGSETPPLNLVYL